MRRAEPQSAPLSLTHMQIHIHLSLYVFAGRKIELRANANSFLPKPCRLKLSAVYSPKQMLCRVAIQPYLWQPAAVYLNFEIASNYNIISR